MLLRRLTVVLLLGLWGCNDPQVQEVADQAYQQTENIVKIGPRDPGSKGIEKVQNYIRGQVSKMGWVLQEQHFESTTPVGKIQMKNLYFDIQGKSTKQILLVAHYDSKKIDKITFVGANDAASSVGLLLALSPWIKSQQFTHTIRVLLVDGEEAFMHWSRNDSLYGSKAYADQISDPSLIQAVVVLDMISDEDLQLIRSRGSDAKLLQILERVLKENNMQHLLDEKWSYVEDDHIPFIQKGIASLHLMDFTFGGRQTPGYYWHTEKDNMDLVSKKSLLIMTRLMMDLLPEIDL
ncbi:MAG: DUF4910 domain-containing protein [Bdellovibrionales bacterium]|nr:DUF4910 domain-containing protein [Bdellovibrionales bacterium]